MSLKKWMMVVGCAGFVSAIAFGCSSSTTSSTPDDDGGTTVVDSGKRDTGGGTIDTGAGGDSGGDICTPPPTVTYTKAWHAPHPHQDACSQANIDLFRKVCLGTQADGGAACKSFTGTAAGKACEECILPSTGTALGALLATGGFVSPNIAGCIAIAQGTVADGAGCASASLNLSECRAVACGACAKDANTTTDLINACDTAADQGACTAESTAAGCLDQLADAGGAAGACLAGTDFDSTYSAIVPVFCLDTGAGDGGTEADAPVDAPTDG
jgi:hypothetical protein